MMPIQNIVQRLTIFKTIVQGVDSYIGYNPKRNLTVEFNPRL